MDHRIARFVDHLAQTSLTGPAFNPYATLAANPVSMQANGVRRHNLRLYLQAMAAARPWLLLVGEAPGYRGCRLTGVPFTSESILLDPDVGPFGARAGFLKAVPGDGLAREATATMIWSAVCDWRPPPLLWNAFPFHPHRHGRPVSNRKPNSQELHLGAAYLLELLALFQPAVVAAVGRSAARALEHAGLNDYHQLRHPSHGGKAAFLAGLNEIRPPIQ